MSKEHGTTGQKTDRLEIRPTQVAAGALASITAAALGSKLGVAGTVAGAGLASVVGAVGASVYQHSIERTRDRVRARVGSARVEPVTTPVGASADAETVRLAVSPPTDEAAGRRGWLMVALAAVLAFVLGIATLTAIELAGGGALSGGGNRTTVGAVLGQPTQATAPWAPTSRPPAMSPAPSSTASSTPAPTSTTTTPTAPSATSTTTPTTSTTTTSSKPATSTTSPPADTSTSP